MYLGSIRRSFLHLIFPPVRYFALINHLMDITQEDEGTFGKKNVMFPTDRLEAFLAASFGHNEVAI